MKNESSWFKSFFQQELGQEGLVDQQSQQNVDVEEQKLLEDNMLTAALKGSLEEIKSFVAVGARVNAVDSMGRGLIAIAATRGDINIVTYALGKSTSNDYSKLSLRRIFKGAAEGGSLEIVQELMKHNMISKNGILDAISYKKDQIAAYFIENNNGMFRLYDEDEDIVGAASILKQAIRNNLPLSVDCIIRKYPEMFAALNMVEVEHEILSSAKHFSVDLVKTLRKYNGYFDVNNAQLDGNGNAHYYNLYKTKSVLHVLVMSRENWFTNDTTKTYDINEDTLLCQFSKEVKFLVSYGVSLDEYKIILGKLLKSLMLPQDASLYTLQNSPYGTWSLLSAQYAVAFVNAVEQGLDVWQWNQSVMKVVVGKVLGLSKLGGLAHIMEMVAKFTVPAQFDEKLEVGTVLLLDAQLRLGAGHGVMFGDIHHGGYMKYLGDTTIACNYHINVRMKSAMPSQDTMLFGTNVVQIAKIVKSQCNMEHGNKYIVNMAHVARVVQVGGDSYVDKPLQHSMDTHTIVRYVGSQCIGQYHIWDDAYDQKLHAQLQWNAETGQVLPTMAHVFNITEAQEPVAMLHPTLQTVITNHRPQILLHNIHSHEDQGQPDHSDCQSYNHFTQSDHSVMEHTQLNWW